jgi:hypothetical protein
MEAKYHRGKQRFSWPLQVQLIPHKGLSGECRTIEGDGHFTLEFDREEKGVVDFGIHDFEVRIPSFRTYVGKQRYRAPITIPEFTVRGSHFKESRGRLERSSGRFVLTLSLDITEKQAPLLPELRNMELLGGFDYASITAHLFESGRIDGESGRFEADGTLYVADKTWRKPGDPVLLEGIAKQGGCNITADLQGSIKPSGLTPSTSSLLIVCPGDTITFIYNTQNSNSRQLIGTDGTNIPLGNPSGTVTVTPTKPGEIRYHVHASNGCSADSGEVVVLVVSETTFHVVANINKDTERDGVEYYKWFVDFTNKASDRVVVAELAVDKDSFLHPVDLDGNRMQPWMAIWQRQNILMNTQTFDKVAVPLPLQPAPFRLAAAWSFYPTSKGQFDPSANANKLSAYLMLLKCS